MVLDNQSSDGYIRARLDRERHKRFKLQITKDGNDHTASYDMSNDGEFITIPLNLGDGYYTFRLYENVYGDRYAVCGYLKIRAELKDKDAPFLVPNVYVDYGEDLVQLTNSICEGKIDKEIFNTICTYVKEHYAYDFIKAVTKKPGMLPDIKGTITKKMGVCQDLSALTVAMLRSQGLPSKLVIGYADKQYHAWTVSKVDGKEILFDPTVQLFAMKKPVKYTEERFY